MANQKDLKVLFRTLLFMVLLLVIFLEPAPAQVDRSQLESLRIDYITVRNNITISRANILAAIRTRAGEFFNRDVANDDLVRIAGLEGVISAEWKVEIIENKVYLIFTIVEQNLIRSISFIGNKAISDNKLAKDMGIRKGDYLDELVVNNGVDVIKNLYHKKGFPFVEVTLDRSALAVGQVAFQITEYTRVKIKSVNYEGNENVKTSELKKALKTRTREFIFWQGYYKEQVTDDDIVKLEEVYHDKGYLNVHVEKNVAFSEDRKSADVTFVINEGPVYIVESINIDGNTFFDNETLSESLRLQVGMPYSRQRGEFDARHIRSEYLELGFVEANVIHQGVITGLDKVRVRFNVVEGSRFRIGQVDIVGNETIHDRVVRRVLDEENFKPGQWYNADIARGNGTGELERTVQRAVVTQSTFIQPIGDDPDHRDALVSIVEGQTGSISLGAGVASDSGLIGQITFDQRNFDINDWPTSFADIFSGNAFRGGGQRLRISAQPGTIQDLYLFSFTEPYLYDRPISLNIVGSQFERGRDGYDEKRTKAYVGFEKRYPDKWRRGISFRIENVKLSDLDRDVPIEILQDKGDTNLFGARIFIRKDTTDSRFLPSQGYNFDAGFEQVGGDYTFGIVDATQRWYKTLYEDLADRKTILETKIYAATIVGDAPVFEKFYAGGTGSLRGFDYRGVSPRGLQTNVPNPERKDPIGSDWILIGNMEAAVPLASDVISALFFVDAGAIDSGGIRASVGTGLQIMLPQWFGPVPMRFELAVPFMKEDEDETRTFTFSVGALF